MLMKLMMNTNVDNLYTDVLQQVLSTNVIAPAGKHGTCSSAIMLYKHIYIYISASTSHQWAGLATSTIAANNWISVLISITDQMQ